MLNYCILKHYKNDIFYMILNWSQNQMSMFIDSPFPFSTSTPLAVSGSQHDHAAS